MATVVEELIVALGLDSKELDKGLNKAEKQITNFSGAVESSLSKTIGKSFGIKLPKNSFDGAFDFFFKTTNDARDLTQTLIERQQASGGLAKGASLIQKGLSQAVKSADQLFVLMRGIFASTLFTAGLAWIAKFVQSFKDMRAEVQGLNKLSKELGVNVEDLSAWNGAVEINGGSAQAFQRSVMAIKKDLSNILY